MKFTESQERSKQELVETIKSNGYPEKYHTLRGGAGFGKTTLIVDILKSIPVTKTVCIAAPTHKAVKVIDTMMRSVGLGSRVHTGTIHSVLGLKLVPRGTEEVIIKDKYSKEKMFDILIIDECSMLGDSILEYILECSSKVVIFVGDECQILPTDSDEISKCFTEVDKQSKLDEVVRCALDSPIIRLATKLRECQLDPFYDLPEFKEDLNPNGEGIHVLPPSEFVETLYNYIDTENFRNNIDYVRCIAYTNARVDCINDLIRKRIHGADVPEYIVGEILIAQESKGSEYEMCYKNAEELEVIEVVEDICFDHTENGLSCFYLTLKKLSDAQIVNVKVIKKESLEDFEFILDSYASRARLDKVGANKLWGKFWEINKDFNKFKHVYCMTSHKSQGSTFDNTFVYLPDFLQYGVDDNVKKMLYTATTRSRYSTFFPQEM